MGADRQSFRIPLKYSYSCCCWCSNALWSDRWRALQGTYTSQCMLVFRYLFLYFTQNTACKLWRFFYSAPKLCAIIWLKISINMVCLADYSRVFFEICQFLAQLCYWGHICKRILVGFDFCSWNWRPQIEHGCFSFILYFSNFKDVFWISAISNSHSLASSFIYGLYRVPDISSSDSPVWTKERGLIISVFGDYQNQGNNKNSRDVWRGVWCSV